MSPPPLKAMDLASLVQGIFSRPSLSRPSTFSHAKHILTLSQVRKRPYSRDLPRRQRASASSSPRGPDQG